MSDLAVAVFQAFAVLAVVVVAFVAIVAVGWALGFAPTVYMGLSALAIAGAAGAALMIWFLA